MSSGPTGPRKKVNGNTSPGAPMNSASPTRQAAACGGIEVPAVWPVGAAGTLSILRQPGRYAGRSANVPATAAALNSALATGTQMFDVAAQIVVVRDHADPAAGEASTA